MKTDRPQQLELPLGDVTYADLQTSAQVSNSSLEILRAIYSGSVTQETEYDQSTFEAASFGVLAHQLMYFYLLFSELQRQRPTLREHVDLRSTYIQPEAGKLVNGIIDALFPLLSKLTLTEQVTLAMRCWMVMHEFKELSDVQLDYLSQNEYDLYQNEAGRREIWQSEDLSKRLDALLGNVDFFARLRPENWMLTGPYLLESPYVITYLPQKTSHGILSWVQPDRIQIVDSILSAVDYKFTDFLDRNSIDDFDRVQIASLAVVAHMRSSDLFARKRVPLSGNPALCTVLFDTIPQLIQNVEVYYRNPERVIRGGIDEAVMTPSSGEIQAVVELLKKISSDLMHPRFRSRFYDLQRSRTYAAKALFPQPKLVGNLQEEVPELLEVYKKLRVRV